MYGRLIAPYLTREDTFCVVSSDFCHWYVRTWAMNERVVPDAACRGTRFHYTFYYPKPPPTSTPSIRLSHSNISSHDLPRHPIHASIRALDHEAMEVLTMPPSTASSAHYEFTEYLQRTENTICGRHPIGVLLGALCELQREGSSPKLEWVRYEQSSQCLTTDDSSVSYASAYIVY